MAWRGSSTLESGKGKLDHFLEMSCVLFTLLQKGTQVRFWIQVTIPAPNDPPGSRLSENVKFEILQVGTLTSDFWKTRFFSKYT